MLQWQSPHSKEGSGRRLKPLKKGWGSAPRHGSARCGDGMQTTGLPYLPVSDESKQSALHPLTAAQCRRPCGAVRRGRAASGPVRGPGEGGEARSDPRAAVAGAVPALLPPAAAPSCGPALPAPRGALRSPVRRGGSEQLPQRGDWRLGWCREGVTVRVPGSLIVSSNLSPLLSGVSVCSPQTVDCVSIRSQTQTCCLKHLEENTQVFMLSLKHRVTGKDL